MLRQRLVVLRNLVALGQVRIKIIFPRKNRSLVDAAIQRHRRQRSELHSFLIQHRQGSRHSQANRAHIGVGRSAKTRRARTENLRRRQQLDVHFQPNDRLIAAANNRSVRHNRHDSAPQLLIPRTPCAIIRTSATAQLRLRWRAQILIHRNFKIHQLHALGIIHAGNVDVRAR